MARHYLKLMGPPLLTVADETGTETPARLSRSNLALLALIALPGNGAALSRAVVAETLWPDTPPDKSASRLSTAIWRLQNAIGDAAGTVLSTESGRIGLHKGASLKVDILQIARCTENLKKISLADWPKPDVAALEAAINQRRGAFLDGLDGDWVLAARQRCAEIYESGLEALIRFHRQRGHVERSITAARSLVRQDPYREDIQAVLVELYASKGQRNRAIEQYTSCRDLLRTDLGVEPGRELDNSLRAALLAQGTAPNTDLLAMLRTIDSTVDRLARQVNEIHEMLERQRPAPDRKIAEF